MSASAHRASNGTPSKKASLLSGAVAALKDPSPAQLLQEELDEQAGHAGDRPVADGHSQGATDEAEAYLDVHAGSMNGHSYPDPPPAPRMPLVSDQPTGWLLLEEGVSQGAGKGERRWCFLMRAFLFHAASQKTHDLTHPKGTVDLKGCSVSLAAAATGGGGSGSSAEAVNFAFVISHPRRAALTLTASSESERDVWVRALNAAIMAPTHALLSYKGKQIFDEEDAAAIEASQQAIRGFVSEKILRIAAQKRAVDERVQRKRAEIRASKAQKKALAQKLIALQQQHANVSAEGVGLSLQLTHVQLEARNFEQAQRAFFLQLVSLINEMEEADINRWTSADTAADDDGDDGDDVDDDEDVDSYPARRYGSSVAGSAAPVAAGSPRSSKPAGARSSRKPYSARLVSPVMQGPGTRRGREAGPTRSAAVLENEIIDSGWTPAAPAQPHIPAAFQIPSSNAALGGQGGFSGLRSELHAQLGSSPVRRAQMSSSTFAMPRTMLMPVAAGSAGGGGGGGGPGDKRAAMAASKTSNNFGSVSSGGGEEDEEASAISLSNEQLKYVSERVDALLQSPVDGSGGEAAARPRLQSTDFSALGTTPHSLGTSLAGASVTSPDSLLSLSRGDQLELEEVRRAALGMLSGNLQLRQEQNLLTHYVDKVRSTLRTTAASVARGEGVKRGRPL